MIHSRRHMLLCAVLLLAAAASMVSCYPGNELTVSDTDVVVTLFDKTVDFGSYATYAMPDTVIHLVEEGKEDNISRAYDAQILADIAGNMDALGFTRVADPAQAGVHLLTALTVQDYSGYAFYGWYWDYWYGYPPGWGWYPWYPSGGVAYSYSVGTIFITMQDPDRSDASGKRVPPIWSAAMNGLVSTGTNAQRISKGIDQAFAQSRYLGKGK